MAKAQIVTKNGTKVSIEGSADEVAALIDRFEGSVVSKHSAVVPTNRSKTKSGPRERVIELISAGFFKRPQGLGAIKVALEEQGHFYPVTTLSPALLRLVRDRVLRRIKENNVWSYVQP